MKRVLVLGSNGFIGRNLVAELSRVPDMFVTGFGRNAPFPTNGTFSFVQGSFDDTSVLASALRGQDVVYHLISQTIPSTSWDKASLDVEKNLLPTLEMIRLAAEAGVRKICFASSGGTVYGLNSDILTELSPTEPFSPYGIVKRTIESFLEYARHRHGIEHDIYRISNAYGEGQDVTTGLGFINTALESVLNGRPVVVYGDGSAVRDFIYVKDVARMLAHGVLSDDGSSNIFNVSANRATSLNEVLELIAAITGIDFNVEYRRGRANDNRAVSLDNSKIMRSFACEPLTSLEHGVRETYEFLKKRAIYVEKSVR